MKDPGSEQSTHSLNARLLRFRSQPGSEEPSVLAEDLIAAKRYAEARDVLAIARGAGEDGALLVLEGRAYVAERDMVRAQASLLRAVRAAPELAEAYRWLGHVLLKRGDPQRALKTLRRALELDPRDDEARKLALRAEHLSEAVEAEGEETLSKPPLPKPPARPARPANAASAEEPSSHFRRLTGRPDNRAATRGGSGTMPAVVKSAMARPPSDPELGRYSAQNITAEQFVPPISAPSARAKAQPTAPSKRAPSAPRIPALKSRGPEPAMPKPVPARPQLPPEPARQRRPSPPPEPRSVDPAPPRPAHRTSPQPPRAAALPTWDEQDGIAVLDASLPPTAATSAAVGAPTAANQPADADAALDLVRRYGLFEEGSAGGAQWAAAHEVEPRGTRVRNALIGLWVFTLLASIGGYFGWQAFVQQRHARAAAWIHDARALMLRGDHAGLVDAERLLRLAREQHPASPEIPLEALILQVERVLEDGERDLAALKIALSRAPLTTDGKSAQATASAVIAAFGGDRTLRDKLLDEALATAPNDARRLHLLGRLEERLGRAEAREHIERASESEKKLVPARLALAVIAFDAGEREDALQRVDAVLAQHKEHLRALLFRAFMRADDAEPAQLAAALAALAEPMKLAGPVDELLFKLAQARVLRRQARLDDAAEAVEHAAATTVDDPRLLSWVAKEALALDKPALAQQAAGRALSVAPDVAPYRRLLARVLIERGDGARARELLAKLPPEDAAAQVMKAQAALLEEDEAALKAGLAALELASAAQSESAAVIGALRVRLESKLTPGKAVVDRAKALVKSAPGDPEALLALAEAAVAAHDPATATSALKQRFAVAPDDANAHYLLGRARRMAADAEGAEASFRKALTLSPGQSDSLVALGGLLLDQGKFEEADAVFQELASRGGSAIAGRLGRVEALVSLGRADDAQVQLDAVPEAQHTGAAFRSAAARVALARGKPGDALGLLRPLLETQADKPALLALYGEALLAAEQVDAAASAFDKALALDAGSPEALLGRAEVYVRAGAKKSKEALAALDSAKSALAARVRPPALRAQRLILVGRTFAMRNKRGDDDAAKQALREAVKLNGAPAAAYFWLGEVLGGKSNLEARTAYQRYLELAPSGKYADRARRALQ